MFLSRSKWLKLVFVLYGIFSLISGVYSTAGITLTHFPTHWHLSSPFEINIRLGKEKTVDIIEIHVNMEYFNQQVLFSLGHRCNIDLDGKNQMFLNTAVGDFGSGIITADLSSATKFSIPFLSIRCDSMLIYPPDALDQKKSSTRVEVGIELRANGHVLDRITQDFHLFMNTSSHSEVIAPPYISNPIHHMSRSTHTPSTLSTNAQKTSHDFIVTPTADGHSVDGHSACGNEPIDGNTLLTSKCGFGLAFGEGCDQCKCFSSWIKDYDNVRCTRCMLLDVCVVSNTSDLTFQPDYCIEGRCICRPGYSGEHCEYKATYGALEYHIIATDEQKMDPALIAATKEYPRIIPASIIQQSETRLVNHLYSSLGEMIGVREIFIQQATQVLSHDGEFVITLIMFALQMAPDDSESPPGPSHVYSVWKQLQTNFASQPIAIDQEYGNVHTVLPLYDPHCIPNAYTECPEGYFDYHLLPPGPPRVDPPQLTIEGWLLGYHPVIRVEIKSSQVPLAGATVSILQEIQFVQSVGDGDGDGGIHQSHSSHTTTMTLSASSGQPPLSLYISQCFETGEGAGAGESEYMHVVGHPTTRETDSDAPMYQFTIPDDVIHTFTVECLLFTTTRISSDTAFVLSLDAEVIPLFKPPYTPDAFKSRILRWSDIISLFSTGNRRNILETMTRTPSSLSGDTLPDISSGSRLLVNYKIPLGPWFYFIPGDIITLSGSLWSHVATASCSINWPMEIWESMAQQFGIDNSIPTACHYSASHPSIRADGVYLACELFPFNMFTHAHPPKVGHRSMFSPVVVRRRSDLTVTCEIVIKSILEESESLLVSTISTLTHQQRLSSSRPEQLFHFLNNYEAASDMYTMKRSPSWSCGEYEGHVGTMLIVSCHAIPRTCQGVRSPCGEPCMFQSDCVIDGVIHQDIECISRGLPKPFLFDRIYSPCPRCDDADVDDGNDGEETPHPDPACNITPRFTPILVDKINTVSLYELPNIHKVESGKTYEDADDYDIDVYYGDIITLSWSYMGLPTAQMNLYLIAAQDKQSEVSHPPPLPFGGRIHIATVAAHDMQYSFRPYDIPTLHSYGHGIKHIQFDGEIGTMTHDAITNIYRTHHGILHLQKRCANRPPLVPRDQDMILVSPSRPLSSPNEQQTTPLAVNLSQSTSSSSSSSFYPISTSCQNYGICNDSTAQCTCYVGFLGDMCQYHIGDNSNQGGGSDGGGTNEDDRMLFACHRLECVYENTKAFHDSTQQECIVNDTTPADNPHQVRCNCHEDYFGEQCQHQRVCEQRTCVNGRLITPDGHPDECICQCNHQHISGSACNQCSLSCRNGGVVNTQCTQCNCQPGYIGAHCQIPVWYHSFTLRNLPQHIVELILNTSPFSKNELAMLQQTMVKLLLEDYGRALDKTHFIVYDDDDDGGDGGGNSDSDMHSSNPNDSHTRNRIRVRVELTHFQTVIPPGNPNAPYVYIKLMLYPAEMSDDMLEYAQKNGLTFDWSLVTNQLDFFKQFLRERGMLDDDQDPSFYPDIEDPGCTTRACHDTIVIDDDSSNHAVSYRSRRLICNLYAIFGFILAWFLLFIM